MVDSKQLERVRGRCGFTEGSCLGSEGNSGGMGLWWRDINVHIFSYSRHHIAAEVRDDNNNPVWVAVGVYGWPETENKHRTWDMMRTIQDECEVPTVFFGDFNEIVSMSEKEGGAMRRESLMDAFKEAIDDCGLHDLGFKGRTFTWQRGTEPGSVIRERLDRFLVSEEWHNLFPRSMVRHFPIYKSDHAPILLNTEAINFQNKEKRRFHFEALWLASEECRGVVESSWNGGGGSSLPVIIARCAEDLSKWAKGNFRAVKKRIKEAEKELSEWQKCVPDATMIEKCNNLCAELDDLHRKEETY